MVVYRNRSLEIEIESYLADLFSINLILWLIQTIYSYIPRSPEVL